MTLPFGRRPHVALAAVVTESAVDEFLILKRSLELVHGDHYDWFIRCDTFVHGAMSFYPNVHCSVFQTGQLHVPDVYSDESWRALMRQKINAMEDAWSAGNWEAVAYLDCDIVVVAPFLDEALSLGGQVVLTPHYFRNTHLANISGRYNGGFVLARDRCFPGWWRLACDSDISRAADQKCLDEVSRAFDVKEMTAAANVGWWRGTLWDTPRLPADCQFVHVHLFQHAQQDFELAQKSFALNCVEYLVTSATREHRIVADEIFALDRNGYYRALLRQRVAVLTMCEPKRAIRLLLMAKTLPTQVTVLCSCRGPVDEFFRRLSGITVPPNLRVQAEPGNVYRAELVRQAPTSIEFVFPVDVDFVFPLGFWYRLWEVFNANRRDRAWTCPLALRDPDGRFVSDEFRRRHSISTRPFDSTDRDVQLLRILDDETPVTHYIPGTVARVAAAEPLFPSVSRTIPAGEPSDNHRVDIVDLMSLGEARPPGVLMDVADFLLRRMSGVPVRVATNTFIFHLWHPVDQESECAGWYWRR
jgi:hypothetical protein